MKAKNSDVIMQDKIFTWIALGTVFILLIPLLAMQFTGEVNWTLMDFVVSGTLLFGTGLIFVLAARRFPNHRVAIGVVVAAIFLWLWIELAVGLFTTWGS